MCEFCPADGGPCIVCTPPEPPARQLKVVNVWTDGMDYFQCRCPECRYRGPWRRSEEKAVADARDHRCL